MESSATHSPKENSEAPVSSSVLRRSACRCSCWGRCYGRLPLWPGVFLVVAVLYIIALVVVQMVQRSKAHKHPGYLYFTFKDHGPGSQVYRLNLRHPKRDKALSEVLDVSSIPFGLQKLRGMVMGPNGTLWVASLGSKKAPSSLLHFGPCDDAGVRPLQWFLQSTKLAHPYGVALLDDAVYATTLAKDGSAAVVRFDATNASSPAEEEHAHYEVVFDSTTNKHMHLGNMVSHDGCLYVADKYVHVKDKELHPIVADPSLHGVKKPRGMVRQICNGSLVSNLQVENPVGLTVDAEKGLLYIGSASKEDPHVAVLDLAARKFVRRLDSEGMRRPAGIVLVGSSVLVACKQEILEFSRHTGEFLRVLGERLPDKAEAMLLSPC